MQKIMFNDKYGLTQAVLIGRKTNNNLQSAANHERQIAELAITLLKNEQNIDDIRNNDNP